MAIGNDAVFDQMQATADHANRRVLLRGGTVLTMDPELGEFASGDVLISGTKIVEVGPDLASAASDGQAIVVDLAGAIVMPGMHDTHRHAWQGQFRRLLPDADLLHYASVMHGLLGPVYRPEDMYAGNLVSALGAIAGGITCMMDFSHNARTKAHSDASIDALAESGIRGVHAPCGPLVGEWDHHWPADLERLRGERFASDDQLLTLRLGVVAGAARQTISQFSNEAAILSEQTLTFARELDLEISVDGVGGPMASEQLERLGAAGVLKNDTTYIHCRDLSDGAWRAIVDSGGTVSIAVASAPQFGRANSIIPIQKVLDVGLRPAFSMDTETSLTSDMFTQMRLLLNVQRTAASTGPYRDEANAPAPISVRDALNFATVQGARANGLLHKCGTLTPGKQADMVIIRADTMSTLPLNNAFGTVVLGTDTKNLDGVLIAGQLRLWRGELVGVDHSRIQRLVTESRDRLISISGYNLDIFH